MASIDSSFKQALVSRRSTTVKKGKTLIKASVDAIEHELRAHTFESVYDTTEQVNAPIKTAASKQPATRAQQQSSIDLYV